MRRILFVVLIALALGAQTKQITLTKEVIGGGPAPPAVPVAATLYGTPQKLFQASGTTAAIALPNAGVTVTTDTLVLISVTNYDSGAPGSTAPTGFSTAIQFAATSLLHCDVYYKNYTSGSTLPASVTVTGIGNFYTGINSWAYQGHNVASPIDGTPQTFGSTTATNTIAGPSITTTQVYDTVIWVFGRANDEGAPIPTVSQGTIEGAVTRSDSGAQLYSSVADLAQSSAGASGVNTLTYTNGVTGNHVVAVSLAIKGN